MQHRSGDASGTAPRTSGASRFNRIAARDSGTADLMQGCRVVTVDGEEIGEVDHLMVDKYTHQLRYVMLSSGASGATIAIPWQTLYFDSSRSQLVFYTAA
ncbi:PRC-barrel domain-containing protein [Noviherbaspirillum massiliense]|uniref:PRC-barrel domain-containing protein n=1 Tax=Noviherbaspirillum massiliense TaxID=1465823 RepID=UPI00030F4D5C|nr:PRC-barrel domain-containing protein [Noviherbaspirillum massiliense]